MKVFHRLWISQSLSLLSASLVTYSLAIALLKDAGSVTLYSLAVAIPALVNLMISPFAGSLVDRFNRKIVLVLSCVASLCASCLLLGILWSKALNPFVIQSLIALYAASTVFHWICYASLVSELVPTSDYMRANALIRFSESVTMIASPAIASYAMASGSLDGLVVMDIVFSLVAIGVLISLRMNVRQVVVETRNSILREIRLGWGVIFRDTQLRELLILMTVSNFVFSTIQTLSLPFLNELGDLKSSGLLVSASALGLLAGSLLGASPAVSRIHWGMSGIVRLLALSGFAILLLGLFPFASTFVLCGFAFFLLISLVNIVSQTIWQNRTPVDLQGRAFAVRRMGAWVSIPLAQLLAGPTFDYVVRPYVQANKQLITSLLPWVSSGHAFSVAFIAYGIGSLILFGRYYLTLKRGTP